MAVRSKGKKSPQEYGDDWSYCAEGFVPGRVMLVRRGQKGVSGLNVQGKQGARHRSHFETPCLRESCGISGIEQMSRKASCLANFSRWLTSDMTSV